MGFHLPQCSLLTTHDESKVSDTEPRCDGNVSGPEGKARSFNHLGRVDSKDRNTSWRCGLAEQKALHLERMGAGLYMSLGNELFHEGPLLQPE